MHQWVLSDLIGYQAVSSINGLQHYIIREVKQEIMASKIRTAFHLFLTAEREAGAQPPATSHQPNQR